MKKLNIILAKYTYFFVALLIGAVVSSCSSYRGTTDVEDGIYKQSEKEVVVVKEIIKNGEENNFFARELEKYESLDETDEILLNAEHYSSDNEYTDEEDVKSNAAWGYDTKEVDVTYHVNYSWYHPYHSPNYYGYNNWGYYNWYYPSYYYRPWGYYGYAYYNNPYYFGGYSPYYYGGYYRPYYGGYGYYNSPYYGGYGYNAYDHNYTRPYNEYGRRSSYGDRFGNRRSLSRSVANVDNRGETKPSLIRGTGSISDRINRRGTNRDTNYPSMDTNRERIGRNTQIRDNTSRTSPNSREINNSTQRTNPNQTRRTTEPRNSNTRSTTPTRTTTKPNTSTRKSNTTKSRTTTKKSSYKAPKSSNSSGRNYSSGSSGRSNSGASSSSGSSSSGSRGSSGSSGSSRGGGRR